MHEDDLTPTEREALAALPREAQPGDLLEERTVRAIAGRGWIRSRHRFSAPLAWASAAAACALFFVTGFAIGQGRSQGRAGEVPGLTPVETRTTVEPGRPDGPADVTLVGTDSNRTERTQYVVWF